MSDPISKIIPNSFQTPNFFVDGCMPYLTGNEFKCLSYLARKTFGWQKRSDRVAKSIIARDTGLNNETVDKCMDVLVIFGLVVRMAENNIKNQGVEWALQTDDSKVQFGLMQQRQEQLTKAHQQRTEKARNTRIGGDGLSNNPTPKIPSVEQKSEDGGVVQQSGGRIDQQSQGRVVRQSPQKTNKAKKKNMGADAPARASAQTPEERMENFPQDCNK